MKLRKKLVAVMAASMVVTSVPVVTMAESDNSLSIYNYSIKDSSVGFTTTDKAYDAGAATTKSYVSAAYTDDDGFYYESTRLPKLEISPRYNYSVGKETAFLHLTKDSEFKKEAYLAYVDSLQSGKPSTLYIDKDGNVHNSKMGWSGSADDLIKNNKLTIYFDDSVGGYAKIVSTPSSATSPRVTIQLAPVSKFTLNDREYESTIRMDFQGDFKKDVTYPIPFLAKVGGDKEVLAYLDGKDSFVSTKTFSLTGVLSDKKLTATSDCKTITIDNSEEIGEIRLSENQIHALRDAKNDWIELKLPSNSGLQFDYSNTLGNFKVTGRRGFNTQQAYDNGDKPDKIPNYVGPSGKASEVIKQGVLTRGRDYSDVDEQVLRIKLPEYDDNSAKGEVVLQGIYVEPQDKTAATGDVTITLSEDLTQGADNYYYTDRNGDRRYHETSVERKASTNLVEKTTLKVATVADYGVTITSTPIDVKAGRSGVVNDKRATFSLKESVKDSLVDTRKIEFTLENGYIFGPADVNYKADNDSYYTTDSYRKAAEARFKELIDNETIKFEEDAEAKPAEEKEGFVKSSLSLEIDANGYVTGFSGKYDRLTNTEDDEIKVTLPVAAPVQAKGEIKVKAGNLFTRAHEKDVEAVVAKIIEPISVEVENAAIKVGKQDQKAGKITIKETDKGMFERGWLYLSAEDLQEGLTFDEVPEIKVTSGNMEIKNAQISRDNKVVAFEVTKTSTEASTVEVSNIKFTADRTVPEANYDLQIWGPALTDENILDVANYTTNVYYNGNARGEWTDMYIVPEFITMTTKNTEDISSTGLKAATATFVIGENSFTVNGETVTMDTAAYVKDNYTMVPVKYVAQAFGIEGNAVQYDKKTSTATIVAGSKVISITANKPVITVNGTAMPMATKAEVNKENRMCVPLSYIASALDIDKSWDATTKTATFTNQTEETK